MPYDVNRRFGPGALRSPELGLVHEDALGQCSSIRGSYLVPDRTALEVDYLLKAVFPVRRCRKPQDERGWELSEHCLKRESRYMLTLVYDNLTITRKNSRQAIGAAESLKHGNIDLARGPLLRSRHRADLVVRNIEEFRQPAPPLLDERLPVHEYQRGGLSRGD